MLLRLLEKFLRDWIFGGIHKIKICFFEDPKTCSKQMLNTFSQYGSRLESYARTCVESLPAEEHQLANEIKEQTFKLTIGNGDASTD